MEFSPFNNVVQLCLQGMQREDSGEPEQASKLFLRAWTESTTDYERFLAAFYVARHQETVSDKLYWLGLCVRFGRKVNDNAVKSAFPSIYLKMAECYRDLNDERAGEACSQLAVSPDHHPSDTGPFYHGTRADLQVGELLTAGGNSNYKSEFRMNHIYFTASVDNAGLAAALATGNGKPRVYQITPTGSFENDPNVTDKKFPGNPTRSFRSRDPLKIIAEAKDWRKLTEDELKNWREKLANNKGEIIN